MDQRPRPRPRPCSFTAGLPLGDGHHGRRLGGLRGRADGAPRPVTEDEPTLAGYFNAFPNSSTSHLPDEHPSLEEGEEFPPGDLPSPRLSQIIPVEEEGRESLPAYSCSLRAESVFEQKMEMSSPFSRAESRTWKTVYLVLKGTMLSVHKAKHPGLFTTLHHHQPGTLDRPLGTTAGRRLQTYTLQHAEVGIAGDYQKRDFIPQALLKRLTGRGSAEERTLYQQTRNFVIRLRVETDQFLLSCSTVQTFLYWLECLSAAIDLALPLDERGFPRHRTIPVRRRRRPAVQPAHPHAECGPSRPEPRSHDHAMTAPGTSESAMPGPPRRRFSSLSITKGVQYIRGGVSKTVEETRREKHSSPSTSRWFWCLTLGANVPRGPDGMTRAVIRETTSMASLRRGVPRPTAPTPSPRRPEPVMMRNIVDAYLGSEFSASSFPAAPHPTEEGSASSSMALITTEPKWCPPHNWSYARHVVYARRCMTNLWDNAPRQSDIIVKDGKRWKINWDRGQLVRYDPDRLPGYNDQEPEEREAEPRAILCV
ncbi:MAG: hypothetical protein M1838_005690 [Thelocarpon superellum]|nr:MAG: hypothetical protein M1838_005690 [Thelocarpon superellum]